MRGVIVCWYLGGMNGGHYTAFVRFSSSTDIEFDDMCSSQQVNSSTLFEKHIICVCNANPLIYEL